MYKVTNLDTRHHYQDPYLGWSIGGARFGPLHRDVSDEEYGKSPTLQNAYQKRQAGKACRILVEYIEDKPAVEKPQVKKTKKAKAKNEER